MQMSPPPRRERGGEEGEEGEREGRREGGREREYSTTGHKILKYFLSKFQEFPQFVQSLSRMLERAGCEFLTHRLIKTSVRADTEELCVGEREREREGGREGGMGGREGERERERGREGWEGERERERESIQPPGINF